MAENGTRMVPVPNLRLSLIVLSFASDHVREGRAVLKLWWFHVRTDHFSSNPGKTIFS